MARQRPTRTFERCLSRIGFARVGGVDEVGRGCLAGPVVAAVVVLDERRRIPGLRDSKLLSASQRERCYDLIRRRATAWAVGEASVEEIDRINIYQASLAAMRRAVLSLAPLPDALLVDAVRIPDLPMAQRALVHGDARVSSIAAASIIAKVTRDRLMLDFHASDDRYGFDRHKGYATAEHLRAVADYGLSSVHRRSFRPPSLFDASDC
ncbi:MAG: ribonuclease HII [Vicinamibacterales bacterium]